MGPATGNQSYLASAVGSEIPARSERNAKHGVSARGSYARGTQACTRVHAENERTWRTAFVTLSKPEAQHRTCSHFRKCLFLTRTGNAVCLPFQAGQGKFFRFRQADRKAEIPNSHLVRHMGGKAVSEAPRSQQIADVFTHMAHHRGQLTVYLRLNEAKVPAIYGPLCR